MADSNSWGPPPKVAFIQPIVTGILIGAAFLLIFILALHKPTPHAVPVGVVASPSVVKTLEANKTLTGLDLRQVGSVAEAKQQIKNNDIFAAYVVQGSNDQMLVSSAHGAVATRTLIGMFTDVAAANGAQLPVQDVVPVSPQDPNGISLFYLIFGITLGAFLFGQGAYILAKRLSLRRKTGQTLLFSVLLGIVGALVARVWIQVLPGSVAAETGVLILLAAAIAALTLAITALLGDPGVAVATVVALILGTAVSGGPIPANFIPPGFALFSAALPPGAATTALRDIAYFNAGSVTGPLLVLAAWLVGSALVVVVVTNARRRRATQVTAPNPGIPAVAAATER